MRILSSNMNFKGQPENYAIIDKYVSRSAQPQKEDLLWLKEQGVTDIFNFRTMYMPDINYNEEAETKKLGIKYHSIPSITRQPQEKNIRHFLEEINKVKENNGKAHIHCKAGADRTGMYAFIYKMLNNIGTLSKNQAEWFERGYHYRIYPGLMEWTKNLVYRMKK